MQRIGNIVLHPYSISHDIAYFDHMKTEEKETS